MKKILGLFFILVFLTAGCAQQADSPQKDKAREISGSIEDLLAQNVDLKCEVMAQQEGQIVEGTTYIADDQARSDFQVKLDDQQTMTSHMIDDGTWLYTWSEQFPQQAVKIKLETMQSQQFETEEIQDEATDYGVDNYQAELDYKCYEWNKDEAMFNPPADVNFMDFSQIMGQLQDNLEGLQTGQLPDSDNLCAQCETIPDAQAQEMCKQRLGCN
ncbi:MAG: hypothetical protein GF365_02130 [Candidatus Buchananbacteria bacterium]|nr:hypothetical protein [Candidatus Buchananbacteria bacterium]